MGGFLTIGHYKTNNLASIVNAHQYFIAATALYVFTVAISQQNYTCIQLTQFQQQRRIINRLIQMTVIDTLQLIA